MSSVGNSIIELGYNLLKLLNPSISRPIYATIKPDKSPIMKKYTDLTDPNSFRSKIRRKRLKHLIQFISDIIERENLTTIRICDLGGTYRYWFLFPFNKFEKVTFEITIVNLDSIIEDEKTKYAAQLDYSNLSFKTEVGNACDLPQYETDRFDLTTSNSVVEHVGGWYNIKMFASESQRVSKYHFIQTPNYWFPVEPHYVLPLIHFLPRPIHTRLLMLIKGRPFDKATSNFENNRMLTKSEFKYVYPNSALIKEKFLLLNKSFTLHSKLNR